MNQNTIWVVIVADDTDIFCHFEEEDCPLLQTGYHNWQTLKANHIRDLIDIDRREDFVDHTTGTGKAIHPQWINGWMFNEINHNKGWIHTMILDYIVDSVLDVIWLIYRVVVYVSKAFCKPATLWHAHRIVNSYRYFHLKALVFKRWNVFPCSLGE